jgi:hypothetical protein
MFSNNQGVAPKPTATESCNIVSIVQVLQTK